MNHAIVLAAGKGTRMKSDQNKVMHTLLDRPILAYPIEALKEAGIERILIVAGWKAESLIEAFPDMEFAIQEQQLGTGHAVMQCTALENEKGKTLIINGDVPYIQPETIQNLLEASQDTSLTLLSAVLDDGASYGRIVRDEDGEFLSIVEAKDCTPEQKKICEINAGVYCFDNEDLFQALKELKNDNAQNEYYLTDLVKILHDKGKKVSAIAMSDPDEMAGINTMSELAQVSSWMQNHINEGWMAKGVQIMDPKSTYIGKDVKIDKGVVLYPDTIVYGKSELRENVQILPFSFIKNAVIDKQASVQFCKIVNTKIPAGQSVCMQVIGEEVEN